MKSILLKIHLSGYGIVNYDGDDQEKLLRSLDHHLVQGKHYDNVNFAKKNIEIDKNGKVDVKIKISSSALRKHIFGEEEPGILAQAKLYPEIYIPLIATPTKIIRGYTYTTNSPDKKKSQATITDAVQTNGAISKMETFTTTSRKTTKKNSNSDSDTTFFVKETIGNVDYLSYGSINLNELQFMSCDDIYDRTALTPDLFDLYSKYLKYHIKSFNSKLGYYKIKNSINEIPEYGFKFNDEDINHIVKYLFISILKVHIQKAGAFAKVTSFEYKIVENAIEDKMDSEDGWIKVKTPSDYKDLNIITEDYYVECDPEKSALLKKNYDEAIEKNRLAKESKRKEIDDINKKNRDNKEKAKKLQEQLNQEQSIDKTE